MISHINSDFMLNYRINNQLSDIKLFSKGDIAYNQRMDLDENDVVYMTEFREFSDENDVVGKEKAKLMATMESSKMVQDIAKNKEETQQKEQLENKPKEEPKKPEFKIENKSTASACEIINYKNAKAAYKASGQEQQ